MAYLLVLVSFFSEVPIKSYDHFFIQISVQFEWGEGWVAKFWPELGPESDIYNIF